MIHIDGVILIFIKIIFCSNISIWSNKGLIINDFKGEKINLKEIESNIQELSPLNKTHKRLSIKDILMTKDGYMYLSYVKLTNNNCHNIAIAKAKMSFDKISFSEFFSY